LVDQNVYADRVHVRKDKTNPRRLAVFALLLFAAEPAWPLVAAGVVLVVAAVLLHGWAAGYLARAGYVEREKILTVRGPYRHNRNPYYVAQLTMDVGFFLLAGQPLFLLFYLPIIFTVYRRWVENEEKFLEAEFGENYRVLKSEVPRWRFQLKAAPARGEDLTFQWSTYKLNRELARSLSHIFVMLLFVLFYLFGNPLAQIDFDLRLLVLAVVGSWLVVRDIFPVAGMKKSVGWAVVALGMAVLAAFYLTTSSLWRPWSGAGAWLAIALGLYCASTVILSAFLGASRRSSEAKRKFVTRPICQWYVLALGFGLLSCTLGGVWLGITMTLVLWALHIGRWVSIPMVPRGIPVGLFLSILLTVTGGAAVLRQLQ
jgi:protein-S-isoprenylcysteine O-methyltransferase Ste14